MRRMAIVAAGAALTAIGPAAAATADCTPLAVQSIAGSREAHFIDQDASGGASLGDTRNGVLSLRDADGKPVGKEYWLATVQAVGADGKPSRFDEVQVFVFDDGALFTSSREEPAASFDNTETTIVPTGMKRRVVGGTGAYAGARGTMDTTVDGVDFTFRFDVTCK